LSTKLVYKFVLHSTRDFLGILIPSQHVDSHGFDLGYLTAAQMGLTWAI